MGVLDNRLRRLERDSEAGEDENPMARPLPREVVHSLDAVADLKRERLLDDSTSDEDFERLLIGRGVEPPWRARSPRCGGNCGRKGWGGGTEGPAE